MSLLTKYSQSTRKINAQSLFSLLLSPAGLASMPNFHPSRSRQSSRQLRYKHVERRHSLGTRLHINYQLFPLLLSRFRRQECHNRPSPLIRDHRENVSALGKHASLAANGKGNATSNSHVPHARHMDINVNTPQMMAPRRHSWTSHMQVTCPHFQRPLNWVPVPQKRSGQARQRDQSAMRLRNRLSQLSIRGC